MKKMMAVLLVSLLPACGGGGDKSPTSPVAPPPTPRPTPTPEPVAFGPGQYLVNTTIRADRYFADPPNSACYWERQSGLGGTLDDIISNDFVGYDARQIIVDILSSDLAFEADSDCGSWYTRPRHPAQTNITPGMWLVGEQLPPGTYQANVGAGCYWERLRNFEGGIGSIIANDFIPDAGPHLVSISADDVGFNNDGDCGNWEPATGAGDVGATSASDIARARRLNRTKRGLRPSFLNADEGGQ